MNVKTYNTRAYENIANWTLGQNKPNSKPNKPNFRKAKMDVNLYFIEDYKKNDDFVVRINKANFQNAKTNVNSIITKDYRKNDCLAAQKTNPIQTQSKPISSKAKMNVKSLAGKSGHTLSERIFAKNLNLGTIVQ